MGFLAGIPPCSCPSNRSIGNLVPNWPLYDSQKHFIVGQKEVLLFGVLVGWEGQLAAGWLDVVGSFPT